MEYGSEYAEAQGTETQQQRTPQDLQELVQQQQEEIKGQSEEMKRIRSLLEALHSQILRTQPPQPTQPFMQPPQPPQPFAQPPQPAQSNPQPKQKRQLPELSEFSGDRKEYRAWSIEAQHKLQVDGDLIGIANQRAYLYSRLAPKAQRLVTAFIKKGSGDTSAAAFLHYLDSIFEDPNSALRALSLLQNLKQRPDESFATFLPKFEQTMREAEVGLIDQEAIAYLRGAINDSIKQAIVALPRPTSYTDFVELCGRTSSGLDEIRYSKRAGGQSGQKRTTYTTHSNPRVATKPAAEPAGDPMDWEHSRPPTMRSGSLSTEQLEQYRRQGKCFGCGQKGHLRADCPQGKKKASSRTRAKAAKPQDTEDEEQPYEAEDSGEEDP